METTYSISLTKKELTEIIRGLESRGDKKTDYGNRESKAGDLCYELAEKLRAIRDSDNITFNDFVMSALSNDIVCVVDNILNGNIISKPTAAYRMINSEYADKVIDRFTLIPRDDGVEGKMIAVTLKEVI